MANIKTFTARMKRSGQADKFLPNATISQGYVVGLVQKGVGKSWEEGSPEGDVWTVHERYEDSLRPYFDVANMPPEIKEKLRPMETLQEVIEAGLEGYLLKFGEQDGYTIASQEEEAEVKKIEREQAVASKQAPIRASYSYFGVRLSERVPTGDWERIKGIAKYHSGDENDLEDLDDQGFVNANPREVRGWYYPPQVVDRLTSLGYTVLFANTQVKTSEDLAAAHRAQEKAMAAHFERLNYVAVRKSEYRAQIVELALKAGACSAKVSAFASTLPRLTLLDMKGPDVYGGGAWLHLEGETLYYVSNNGMDGDDWARNNYDTGGAGAICYEISGGKPLFEEIKAWSESLGEYQIYAND